jgi:hypothetical protein
LSHKDQWLHYSLLGLLQSGKPERRASPPPEGTRAVDRYLDVIVGPVLEPLEHGSAGLAGIEAFFEGLGVNALLLYPYWL